LILHDDKLNVNAENIEKVLTAANIKVPSVLPKLFANLLENVKLDDLLLGGFGGGGGGGGGSGGGDGGGASKAKGGGDDDEEGEKEKEKEEESAEESEKDMGLSLFD